MFESTSAFMERAKAELVLVRTDRKGVTALEYGLLAGLIAVAIIVAVTALGTGIAAEFDKITAAINAA